MLFGGHLIVVAGSDEQERFHPSNLPESRLFADLRQT
jgi:hypothetical protein